MNVYEIIPGQCSQFVPPEKTVFWCVQGLITVSDE